MRARAVVVVVCLAVALGGAAYYVYSAQKAKADSVLRSAIATVRAHNLPAGADDYRNLLGQPQGDNAFDHFRLLAETHEQRIRTGEKSVLSVTGEEALDPEVRARYAHYMAALRDAARCKSYVPVREWEQGLATLFPDFAHAKAAARFVKASAKHAIDRGALHEALTDASDIARVANFLRSESHLLAVFVAGSLDVMAYQIVFEASTQFDTDDWAEAQRIVDGVLPALKAKEAMVGDMVMFVETVDDVCEGGPVTAELLEAADPSAGKRTVKRMSLRSSAAIRAEARLLWVDVFEAAKDLRDYEAADEAYQTLFTRLVAWSLFDEFPVEVAKILESLMSTDLLFEGLYNRAVHGDMVRRAFSLARTKELPADGQMLDSSPSLGAQFRFARVRGGFSLTFANGEKPIEVFYPKKP